MNFVKVFLHTMMVEDGQISSDGKIFTKPIIRKDLKGQPLAGRSGNTLTVSVQGRLMSDSF
jgi:hypothetical protein